MVLSGPKRDILDRKTSDLTIDAGLSIRPRSVGPRLKLQPSHQIANLLQGRDRLPRLLPVTNHTSIFAAVGLASGTMKLHVEVKSVASFNRSAIWSVPSRSYRHSSRWMEVS